MSVIQSRFLTRTAGTLVLAGALGLAACDEQQIPSPTEPAAEPADALVKNASKKVLIAFSSSRDGGNPEIYTMTDRGRQQTRLTTNTDFDLAPAWSPDRTRIAFASFPNGGTDVNIFVMNADGTGRTQLTTDPSVEENPDWSPDGSKIAFNRNGSIVVMNADGSGQTELPNADNDNDWDPDWSSDGTRIVLSRDRGSTQLSEIWVMNADGSGAVQLTQNSFHDSGATWSPDGSKIAFESNRNSGVYQVFVMNADGSGQTQLTSGFHSSGPAWSPDGSKIAFETFASGNLDLYVMNADGSRVTQLTTDPASDVDAAWAR
jgi:Tol biopolymer transport system component